MEYEVKDRNEWFEEVERAYSNIELKTVNRPYEMPIEADIVEGEDILWALGLHPRLDTSEEFFATNGEIMVGPCSSHGEVAHEFFHWKMLREASRYNARKEHLA